MTEAEWRNGLDPARTLDFLDKTVSERKLRLFAVACCYRIRQRFAEWTWELVELAERYADGLEKYAKLRRTYNLTAEADLQFCGLSAACHAAGSNRTYSSFDAKYAAEHCAANAADMEWGYAQHVGLPPAGAVERAAQGTLLRDIFGNPFRPVAFDPSWRSDTAVSLARVMYETRDFGAMPILADALQDAGCEHADILDHCRGDGPHVRGCWVVDLILGKA